MDSRALWNRYKAWLYDDPATGFRLDVSRMELADDHDTTMAPAFAKAFAAMDALEKGAIANPDENRMVGHYWLRAPERAPTAAIAGEIRETLRRILAFAEGVHEGRIRPDEASRFTDLLTIGIGGSAFGPQFLPGAPRGLDTGARLGGAATMVRLTAVPELRRNPAALLALAWHAAGQGRGAKDMVILPYKDRLALFSRYLQQLVMESLGKERDLDGNVVHQGIAVYGNKGSTDQHAYVQQLRDGVPNFFATFIDVTKDRDGAPFEVDPGVTSGDYLSGFLQGTRRALHENGRGSVTITVPDVGPTTVGMLIALYERAVGFYATLVNVNAYHQPGVEAGKKAGASLVRLQHG